MKNISAVKVFIFMLALVGSLACAKFARYIHTLGVRVERLERQMKEVSPGNILPLNGNSN